MLRGGKIIVLSYVTFNTVSVILYTFTYDDFIEIN